MKKNLNLERKINVIKSIFVEIHKRDDTLNEEELIKQCLERWSGGRAEILSILNEMLKSKFILSIGKEGKRLLWINPEKYRELEQNIYF